MSREEIAFNKIDFTNHTLDGVIVIRPEVLKVLLLDIFAESHYQDALIKLSESATPQQKLIIDKVMNDSGQVRIGVEPSLDGCPFKYCDKTPKCVNDCRYNGRVA